MYDTINFHQPNVLFDLDSFSQYLHHPEAIVNLKTGEFISYDGMIGNFFFRLGANWLFASGSLPRLIYPDNTFMMDCEGTRRCIELLSDKLHYDMSLANVTRLDIAATFAMEQPVRLYLECLGGLVRFKRVLSVQNETVYYRQGGDRVGQELVFYDKLREALEKRGIIPKGVEGENLLRYERRWHGKLPARLKEPEIKGCTLYDERFLRKIVELWAKSYLAIEKKKITSDDGMRMIKSPSDGFRYIIAKALETLPADFVINHIETMQAYDVYQSPNYYSRLRGMFREIQNQANMMHETELTNELDMKILELKNIITTR